MKVETFNQKPSKEEEKLNEWAEEDKILLYQLQKQLRRRERVKG